MLRVFNKNPYICVWQTISSINNTKSTIWSMQFLYNSFIQLYILGFKAFAIFNTKAKKGWMGRKRWEENLKNQITTKHEWIWMHCSSLGEFEQGRPVFEALKQAHPDYKMALSFFSPSGYEVRKNYVSADVVFYLPFDSPQNAKKLAQILKPKLWILAKYDYWYNHLKYQSQHDTKIVVVSAIFRPKQIYFKPYGKWFAKNLKSYISHFFVQDKTSQKLLETVGISQSTIAGDTRFDRVKSIAKQTKPLDWVEDFKGDANLIVVGSSWKDDEDLWISFINQKLPPNWKVIMVPHEIKTQKIQQLQKQVKENSVLYSQLSNTNIETFKETQVIIVDAIGLLSQIYVSADIAYVGGGFNKSGVHNTLEPTVFGTPTIIGPNYEKFNEVKMLIQEKVVFSISNYQTFESKLLDLIENEEMRNEIHHNATKVFQRQPPSTRIILDNIKLTR